MILVRELVKNFGTRNVLKGLSFDIRRGEVLALLGEPGAGKTTTLRLLCNILEPTTGRVEIADPDIPVLPDGRGFKARVGYFPAEPFLFEYLTGREMLYFIATLYHVRREEADLRVDYYLRMLNLSGEADRLLKHCTRGVRRKISLVGSVLHQPLYWFLDDPAEALDAAAVTSLKALICCMKAEGRGVMICTDQPDFAMEVCDRVLVLRHGEVEFCGSTAELRVRVEGAAELKGVYRALSGDWVPAGPPAEAPA
jgi:ABC-2 type transport system ATP-binding protein